MMLLNHTQSFLPENVWNGTSPSRDPSTRLAHYLSLIRWLWGVLPFHKASCNALISSLKMENPFLAFDSSSLTSPTLCMFSHTYDMHISSNYIHESPFNIFNSDTSSQTTLLVSLPSCKSFHFNFAATPLPQIVPNTFLHPLHRACPHFFNS